MKLGFIDFEATGTDPKTARIIEYAFMLYDTDLQQPLVIRTDLVAVDTGPSKEIEELTGISPQMLKDFGVPLEYCLEELALHLDDHDFLVAHNAFEYDKVLLETEGDREDYNFRGQQWIDTMYDLPYPKGMKERKLTHLAAAHEFVNPFPHRAIADVFTLQKIFCKYDLKSILTINSTPLITIRADVTFNNKDLAKNAGYRWDGERKIWTKRLREFFLEREIRDNPFKVIVLS